MALHQTEAGLTSLIHSVGSGPNQHRTRHHNTNTNHSRGSFVSPNQQPGSWEVVQSRRLRQVVKQKAWLQKKLTQLESEETRLRQRKPHFSAPTAANFPATGNFWQPLTQGRVWGKALRVPTEDAPARNVGAKPNTKFTTPIPAPRPTPHAQHPHAPPPTPKPKGKGRKKPRHRSEVSPVSPVPDNNTILLYYKHIQYLY